MSVDVKLIATAIMLVMASLVSYLEDVQHVA